MQAGFVNAHSRRAHASRSSRATLWQIVRDRCSASLMVICNPSKSGAKQRR
jgi:hypothetical protein